MRVTFRLNPQVYYDTQTVGRAQVLINKDTNESDINSIKRKVMSIITTLGNVRYYEEVQKNIKDTKTPDQLMEIVVKTLNEIESAGHIIVFLEVKIRDFDFKDYVDLLQVQV